VAKLGGRKQAVDDVGRAFDAVVDKRRLSVAADDEQGWRFALFQARGKLDVDLAAVGPHSGESLELRAPPRPVTRINRKLLAAVVGLGLALLAGLVVLALNPPSWRSTSLQTELYNVDNKPKADGLTRLPASYEGVTVAKKDPPKGPVVPQLQLTEPDANHSDRKMAALPSRRGSRHRSFGYH
jgi:hypothetical protein